MTNKPFYPHSNVTDLLYWIRERHIIYCKRRDHHPKPWTKDPSMLDYRFCNVYRELDAVTMWIADNWRNPHQSDNHLWFAMLVARYINEPATLYQLGYPVPWEPRNWLDLCERLQDNKCRIFNPAYIIPPTAGSKVGGTTVSGPKHEALARFFNYFWEHRSHFEPLHRQRLDAYANKLCEVPGMGTFFAGQVIGDLKYTKWLGDAPDWWSFAVSGPGSRRGMNRVVGRATARGWRETEWKENLNALRAIVNTQLYKWDMAKLHGQDLQNCLCEFDKWERHKLKQGKPKQKFNGRS